MIRDTSKESTKKFNYVYKLTLKSDPSIFYIGKRSTNNENDNYMGSGKALKSYKEKYGKDCFNKEILSYWDTAEEALLEEQRLVTSELVKDEHCLNRIVGGGNFDTLGCKWGKRTEAQNKRNSEAHKGLKQSDETKLKRSVAITLKWQDPEYQKSQKKGRKNVDYKTHLSQLSKQRQGQVCLIKEGKWKYVNQDEVQKFIDLGWAYRGVKNKPTYNELLKLREQGLSYQRIGEMYGVTESCVRRWKKKYESK